MRACAKILVAQDVQNSVCNQQIPNQFPQGVAQISVICCDKELAQT
jgi:hypothetical protein